MAKQELLLNKASEILSSDESYKVLGWAKGEFEYDPSPAFFANNDELKDFVYNDFCGANLSKYLIEKSKQGHKVAVFLKACDTFSFNQLMNENRIKRELVKPIVVGCSAKLDINKIKESVEGAVIDVKTEGDKIIVSTLSDTYTLNKNEYLLEKCRTCKGFAHIDGAEELDVNDQHVATDDRFAMVSKLEKMTDKERFEFWQNELSKCIRCNACRNVCPACSCVKCVFDNDQSGVATKAPADTFEEQLFHIIRAYHVAGRCTDCGECSRVCPVHIPLHLLNRKFIKDSNTLYGDYQSGESDNSVHPLTRYSEADLDPTKAINKTEGN